MLKMAYIIAPWPTINAAILITAIILNACKIGIPISVDKYPTR